MRKVRIKLIDVGNNFGTEGRLIALNGREVASTEPVGLRFDAAAERQARALAERLGYEVVGIVKRDRPFISDRV